MQSLIFFTKSISHTGGKEKMVAAIANYLSAKKIKVKIITYDDSLQSAFYLHQNIEVANISLHSMHLQKNFISKVKSFFADINNYKKNKNDVKDFSYLIATDNTIATIVYYAFRSYGRKIIIWEHLSYVKVTSAFWKYMRRKVYPKVFSIVALNKEEESFYAGIGCTVKCIPNFVELQIRESQNPDHFIWVGSLEKEKGTEELLQLSKKIKEHKVNFKIFVFGNGNEEKKMQRYILENALQNIIVLKEIEKDICSIYKNALALLITSKFECLPMVIIEAFSFGIPVIAFDCPTGPRNVIENGKTGFLIKENNIAEMFEKMMQLKKDNILFKKLSDASFQESYQYAPEKIKQQWDTLLG